MHRIGIALLIALQSRCLIPTGAYTKATVLVDRPRGSSGSFPQVVLREWGRGYVLAIGPKDFAGSGELRDAWSYWFKTTVYKEITWLRPKIRLPHPAMDVFRVGAERLWVAVDFHGRNVTLTLFNYDVMLDREAMPGFYPEGGGTEFFCLDGNTQFVWRDKDRYRAFRVNGRKLVEAEDLHKSDLHRNTCADAGKVESP